MEVTYVCGHTKKRVVSSEGMPEGWVMPTHSLADENQDMMTNMPEKYTIVAFSSEEAMSKYINNKLNKKQKS